MFLLIAILITLFMFIGVGFFSWAVWKKMCDLDNEYLDELEKETR